MALTQRSGWQRPQYEWWQLRKPWAGCGLERRQVQSNSVAVSPNSRPPTLSHESVGGCVSWDDRRRPLPAPADCWMGSSPERRVQRCARRPSRQQKAPANSVDMVEMNAAGVEDTVLIPESMGYATRFIALCGGAAAPIRGGSTPPPLTSHPAILDRQHWSGSGPPVARLPALPILAPGLCLTPTPALAAAVWLSPDHGLGHCSAVPRCWVRRPSNTHILAATPWIVPCPACMHMAQALHCS